MKEKGQKSASWAGLSLSLIGDAIALIGSLAVIGLSVADALKFYEADWYKAHQVTIIVCLLAFLLIAVIVERRTTIAKGFRENLIAIGRLMPDPLGRRLNEAGITNVYTSRGDYARYRGAAELQEYVRTAKKTIHIAAYWMSHGVEMEGIAKQLGDFLASNSALMISIAVVNPESSSRSALASYLDMHPDDLTARIRSSLEHLKKIRDRLPQWDQKRFVLKVYDTLPVMSVIMLDVDEPNGRIQLDVKLYKTARVFSFGVELAPSSNQLYQKLKAATITLIDEAVPY